MFSCNPIYCNISFTLFQLCFMRFLFSLLNFSLHLLDRFFFLQFYARNNTFHYKYNFLSETAYTFSKLSSCSFFLCIIKSFLSRKVLTQMVHFVDFMSDSLLLSFEVISCLNQQRSSNGQTPFKKFQQILTMKYIGTHHHHTWSSSSCSVQWWASN